MLSRLKRFIKKHDSLFSFLFFVRNLGSEMRSFLPIPRTYNDEPLHADTTWQELVKSILKVFPVTSIVETGTCKGTTTDFFASNFVGSIFTCEIMGLYYRESRHRLKKYQHVRVFKESSPRMLAHLKEEGAYGALPLFFLDAHWYNYWPLIDELRIIKTLPKAIIMIDDFKVPDHLEFGYDSQDVGGVMSENSLEFISGELSSKNDVVFFPKYTKGISRGYVLIFHNAGDALARLQEGAFFSSNYKKGAL